MAMANDHGPIPVLVVSGFLGSGKTTLLRNLLLDPEAGEIAVIVNEFGEVGIDHHLVRKTDVRTTLLRNGCVCCSMRDDLSEALRHLLSQRERGTIPRFDRVVIETTGLADPAPILHAVLYHPYLSMRYAVEGVVTVVDAVNGAATLDTYREAVKQAAVAERIVVTKTDLVADQASLALLRERLHRLNPGAELLDADAPAESVIAGGLFGLDGKIADVAAWLKTEAVEEAERESHAHQHGHHHHHHGHDHHHHDHAHGHVHDEHCGHSHGPTPDQLAGPGGWQRGLGAIFAVGLRPCSGAILVLVFALAQGLFWAGIAATFVMGLGTAITVATIAVVAVSAKGLARRLSAGSEGGGALIMRGIEFGAAGLVLLFGVGLLFGYLAAERVTCL